MSSEDEPLPRADVDFLITEKHKGVLMTKKQSSILYGISILLMLSYHLPSPNTDYTPVLKFIGGGIAHPIAWFGAICIGIYAFISGYGMYCTLQKAKGNGNSLRNRERISYGLVGKRILKFMRKYWIVFCIFVPIGYAIGVYQEKDFLFLFENIVFYRFDFNENWWYVKQYVFMLLTLPFIDMFFDFIFQKQYRTCSCAVLLAVQAIFSAGLFYFLAPMYTHGVYYTLIFAIGYLCARFSVFSRLQAHIPAGLCSGLIGWILLAIVFATRSLMARNTGHRGSDVVLAPIFCFAVCLLTRKDGKISGGFAWLGKYSVYMYLTHSFYCTYFFRDFIIVTRIPVLIYLQLIVISLLTSAILLFIEKYLCAFFARGRAIITARRKAGQS